MSTTSLSSAVMTHPVRERQAAALAARLGLGGLALDPDPTGPPSALRTALVAWAARADDAGHHLVVQDDVAAPPELVELVAGSVTRFPDEALIFYTNWHARNGAAARLAALAGAGWVRAVPEEFAPTLAICLPVRTADAFRAFAAGTAERHDDEVMATFLRTEARPGLLAVPTVVEHIGTSSINGHAAQGIRLAVCPVGAAEARPLLDRGWVLEEWGWLPYMRYGEGYVRPVGHEHDADPRRHLRWTEALPTTGLTEGQVRDVVRRHRAEDAAASVGRLFGRGFADELWIHCLLLGRQAEDVARRHAARRAAAGPVGEAAARVRAAALSTVGPAGLPPERRPELTPEHTALMAAYAEGAVRCGGRLLGPVEGQPTEVR
ncbi:hypothetical protein ACFU90_34290 [Streptomyces noursei]|uniref:Uncharacterized protein n=1 Tax=Streptomyces noursei TaxID=1971 RepID=A0A401QQW6_STRNR|nr:hypothetical protein [Streptomyces noursei]UWS76488.1 hypothetical protein N1H47_37740 [Streptomyces noursei]GCB87800.1 hypothetical protein SALB_00469 [Streptomyces noursei]